MGCLKYKCDAIIDELAILPDGNILPCGGFVGCYNETNIYIGDITNGTDNGKINIFLQHNDKDKFECKTCLFSSRCQNDCYAVNNRINKDLLIPCENICRINQIEIKEADRVLNYFLHNKNKLFYDSFDDYLPDDYLK